MQDQNPPSTASNSSPGSQMQPPLDPTASPAQPPPEEPEDGGDQVSRSQGSPPVTGLGGAPQTVSRVQIPDDANDADLIEKEWVVKAKDIVEHTQNNPHEQQKAFSKFKADYMKKRYNKDIKTGDA